MSKRKSRRTRARKGTPAAEAARHAEERHEVTAILASVGAVAYKTDEDGHFYDPAPELIQFFLGPGKRAADLARTTAQELYVIPDQRRAFLARLRHTPGETVNDYVLLKLGGDQPTWCRVRSRYEMTPGGPRYLGIVVKLGAKDPWLPGQLLARKGYSYLRVDMQGRVLYGFSSTVDGEPMTSGGALIDGIGQPWRDTHWFEPRDCDDLLKEVQEQRSHAVSAPLERVVMFKDKQGRPQRVLLQAGLRHSDVGQAEVFEVIWQDTSRLDARLSALRLRDNVHSLRQFENALVQEAKVIAGSRHAAFYRFHDEEKKYILRSVAGLPPTLVLLRLHQLTPDREESLATTLLTAHPGADGSPPVLDEHLIPLTDESKPFGCLWIAVDRGRPLPAAIHTFAESLGAVAAGAEEEAAKRTASRALQAAVDILRKNETAKVYEACAEGLKDELSAAGVSIFEVEVHEGVKRLVLKHTTGIKGIASREDWPKVSYRVGEHLTGWAATKPEGAISILDVQQWRATTPWQEPLYPEDVTGGPVSWLGCPIRNEESPEKELIGFVRLVNRNVTHDEAIDRHVPPGGFSQGDLLLANTLARVAAQYHPLQMMLREHLRLISRSAHELQAPIVSLRAKAHALQRYWDTTIDAAKKSKLADIEDDATNLSDIVYTMDLAARGEAPTPRFKPTRLVQAVIRPTALGALKRVAAGQRYEDVRVIWDAVDPKLTLSLDPSMMRSVFYNLFINAIKYGPDPKEVHVPSIEVQAEIRGADCVISVRDWGMGISMELKEKIFELYFRAPAAVGRDPNGSGIGLFVVRSILEKHEGNIELKSGAHPTEFQLRLPSGRPRLRSGS